MTESVSLTVPYNKKALLRSALYLRDLAEDFTEGPNRIADGLAKDLISGSATPLNESGINEAETPLAPTIAPVVVPEPDQERVETTMLPAAGAGALAAAVELAETSAAAAVAPVPAPDASGSPVIPEGTEALATPDGVEVDSTGLPWDARINASTKTKRVSDDTWKVIRGIDKAFVETVRTELKAAMSVPAAAPAAAPTPAAPTPAAPVAPAPAAPPAPAAATGAITTFAQFMPAVTSSGIPNNEILKAVNNAGLESLQLVAARPDLIPQIVAELGL